MLQISELSTDIKALHPDVAEFHFDDFQRVIHISGCILRLVQSTRYRVQVKKKQKNVLWYSDLIVLLDTNYLMHG